ncbi:MAG: Rnf-Nqr domain containing protein [Deltaproteobacteria bacterium]|nr:Rnf-Nqr domain containing protein [Deltaproteobacteria bacterium]
MSDAQFLNDHQIEIILPQPLTVAPNDFRLQTKQDPDIPLAITKTESVQGRPQHILLTTQTTLDPNGSYQLTLRPTGMQWHMAPSLVGTVLSVLLTACLVQNFVFTRYLGLCVFFGVSRKRETAIGMGVTFTFVGILSGLLAWIINRFVLGPLKLDFLQIIVFIGIISFLVQMTDTVLKKINRPLHKKFGIYVVLITTNCIILAVPLLNAMNNTGFWESLALAIGSGLGFALALFLMSCAREKADLAPVPAFFKGLPIAFILAGLFALAFLGFSGLKI